MNPNEKNTLLDVVRQLSTGKDNKTHDVLRWAAIFTFISFVGMTFYIVVIKDKPFNIQEFGVAISTIFASIGAALKLKETTEPGHGEETTKTTVTKNTEEPTIKKSDYP